jgi:hypothetical protein
MKNSTSTKMHFKNREALRIFLDKQKLTVLITTSPAVQGRQRKAFKMKQKEDTQ